MHRLIETRGSKFIITGSSARALRKKGVNLLAGRALTKQMHPLTSYELGAQFSLTTSLQFGNLPSIYTYEDPKNYLASYVKIYLREEVLQESLTRNLNLFAKFLEVASFSQGDVTNYTRIAKETSSNRHTIANYFDILEDLLIAHRIPIFKKRAKRNMASRPKFYFFDVGVYRSLRPQGVLDSTEELEGAVLETLFLQQAMALNAYFELDYNFYYWRTQNQLEVDFILYGNNSFFAFEIKRKSNLNKADFKAIKTFAADYPMAKYYLLYGGQTHYYYQDDIEVIPFSQALASLKTLLASKS